MIERIVEVPLRESYRIFVGSANLSQLGEKLKQASFKKAVVVSNPLILAHHGKTVKGSLEKVGIEQYILEVPEGEEHKSLKKARELYNELINLGVKRGDLIIALGGGVIGDLAGFVAATYMRGLPLVQVPTTLLAQVDSSIGGKVGVNLPHGKNFIGAFYHPILVLIDVTTLKTLPARELRAGLAEVIKYGFLKDEDFLQFIEAELDSIFQLNEEVLVRLITGCCKIKAQVVAEDEKDTGVRRILNYGHTIGHAIETLTGYQKYLHGEAVAIGMVCAALIAQELGFADDSLVKRHTRLLKRAGLPVTLPPVETEKILEQIEWDKKAQGDSRIFVLLKRIGESQVLDVQPDIIRKALGKHRSLEEQL